MCCIQWISLMWQNIKLWPPSRKLSWTFVVLNVCKWSAMFFRLFLFLNGRSAIYADDTAIYASAENDTDLSRILQNSAEYNLFFHIDDLNSYVYVLDPSFLQNVSVWGAAWSFKKPDIHSNLTIKIKNTKNDNMLSNNEHQVFFVNGTERKGRFSLKELLFPDSFPFGERWNNVDKRRQMGSDDAARYNMQRFCLREARRKRRAQVELTSAPSGALSSSTGPAWNLWYLPR